MTIGGLKMRDRVLWLAAAFAVSGASAPAHAAGAAPPAAPSGQALPAQMQRLLACREIAESAERLACFDRESGTTAEAVQRQDLVVVDRDEVRRTKRTLFGLSLPKFPLLGGDGEDVSQIDGVIDGVGRNRDGGYVFLLKDGSRWSQTDSRPIALEPERGDTVVVKRAALGSFMLSVGKQPGVRVQRVN